MAKAISFPADLTKVHPFWEVLADKSVRIFVQSAFPRVVWLGKITPAIETFIDQFVRRKFPPVVIRDRLHPLLMGGQQPHDFLFYFNRNLLFYMAYKRVLALAFDQRHQESTVVNPAHEVRFPVADTRLLFND